MIEGFLLIDSKMNSVVVPYEDKELKKWMSKVNKTQIHPHKTFKELGETVKSYLKNCK